MNHFADKIIKIYPGFISGIYLTGSITLDDFNSNKSDIDFIVLTKFAADNSIVETLKQIHYSIARKFRKPSLSGVYLTDEILRSTDVCNKKVLAWHKGILRYSNFEMAPISLFELTSNAITVYGLPSKSLLPDINLSTVDDFMFQNINSYWKKWTKQHSVYFGKKLLLVMFPGLTDVVLGVARQLCTLMTGKIVSKSKGGDYCLNYIPSKFHDIISEAISNRKDNRTYPIVGSNAVRPSWKRASRTIECANYIIELFNSIYREKYV